MSKSYKAYYEYLHQPGYGRDDHRAPELIARARPGYLAPSALVHTWRGPSVSRRIRSRWARLKSDCRASAAQRLA